VPLLARLIPSPLSVDVRRGAVAGLADLLSDRRISSQGQVAVVVGPGQGAEVAAEIETALVRAHLYPIDAGSLDAALELLESLRLGSFDAVVGIGGGRTLDVAK
jgi:glycerol-1-phosphate dehydrogenase [NAD(P)+]